METSTVKQNGASEDALHGLLDQLDRNRIRVADIRKTVINGVAHKDFRRRSVVEPTPRALSDWGYFAPNAQKRMTVLVIDDDNEFDSEKLERLGMTPNWVAVNDENHHAQYVFYLKKAVYGPHNARPVRYYNHVARGLSHVLGGDPHFSRGLSRNPFFTNHPYKFHHQHDQRFSLSELRSAVPDDIDVAFTQELATQEQRDPGQKVPFTYVDEAGLFHRRMFIFDHARVRAYAKRRSGIVLQHSDVMPLVLEAAAECSLKMKAIGDYRGALDRRKLEATAGSIARWTNNNLTGWTPEQRRKGGHTAGSQTGAIRGRQNVLDGTLAAAQERGRISQSARKVVRAEEIRIFVESSGLSQRAAAAALGIGVSTVSRAMTRK